MLQPTANAPEAINYIRQDDGNLEALMLAACLTALGVKFSERPGFAVQGDVLPAVNWLFDETSIDGKFKTSEIIAKWGDENWIKGEGNEHVIAYMAAAMRNLKTLVRYHIGQLPKVELVKSGRKTLVIPEGTSDSNLGLLVNKFTRI